MKTAAANRPISIGLAKQGLFLVGVLLTCELGFIGTLGWLLAQTEAEALREERAHTIMSKVDALALVTYDTGDAVGRFSRSLSLGGKDPVGTSKDEVPGLVKYLKENLTDLPEAETLLDRIDKNINSCLPVIADIQSHSAELNEPGAKEKWDEKRNSIQPSVRQLLTDIPALSNLCVKINADAPEKERRARQTTKAVLFIGLAINVLAVMLIGFLFIGRITKRLDVLADNIDRLKDGRLLHPALGGADEIAELDAVFHETASALRREMRVLKAGEARIRTLIESVPVGIVLLDDGGSIEFLNATVEANFKYAAHQLQGKRLAKLFAPGQAVIDGVARAPQVKNTLTHTIELTAVRRDGVEFPVDFTMTTIDLDGEPKTLVMVVDAAEKYKIKKQRQGFVAMVRSELREPLTKISAFLGRLDSGNLGQLSEKGADTTKLMQQNVERLIILLNDLFDLEKLESGKIDIEPTRTKVNVIFERSVNAVSMFAQKHKIRLQVPDCPLELYADPNRIVQVLVNLLSNAIKFSPPDSVVTLAVRQAPTHLDIAVIDQGRGIPKTHLNEVFVAYKQVEEGDAKKKGGTGLGLAICKAIVEAHHGQIQVESEEGRGSVFWMRLPLTAGSGGAS